MKFLIVFVCQVFLATHIVSELQHASLSNPMECARICVEGEIPKICHYRFTMEPYSVLGQACDTCLPSPINPLIQDCGCITSDGVERTVYSINRMIPGPSIQVCKGDKVVVDVENKIPGQGVTIHFHGMRQSRSPHYDGVPFVTQCPIQSGNTFRYQFIAETPGTHFYYSQAGLQKMDGLYGSLIVRDVPKNDENSDFYDHDLPQSVIVISDTYHILAENKLPGKYRNQQGHTPTNILINGKGHYTHRTTNETTHTPREMFWVQPKFRYRFRLINSMSSVCPVLFTIEEHALELIAVDGNAVQPVVLDSIVSFGGERYDFVITANLTPKPYWIQVRGLLSCSEMKMQQHAFLMYNNADRSLITPTPSYSPGLIPGVVLNPLDDHCNVPRDDAVCLIQLMSVTEITNRPDPTQSGYQLFLSFRFRELSPSDVFVPNSKINGFLVGSKGESLLAEINNISFMSPPSPLISQLSEIPFDIICDQERKPNDCGDNCTCTHVIQIPLGVMMELVLVDEIGNPDLHHPFHLHGHKFKVIATGHYMENRNRKHSVEHIQELDKQKLIHRHAQAPYKDVIVVPYNGFAIVRFVADNPGFWMLDSQFLFSSIAGMRVVFWVGETSDLPPIPNGFPKCGDFKTPVTPVPSHRSSGNRRITFD